MISGVTVIASALLYLSALFAVAWFADRAGRRIVRGPARATIYALALAVYCTSWTFYGSVGFATSAGLDFLAIYLGPILVVGFGHRVLERIVRIAKEQYITSVADFIGARYGKSERVAALVSIVAAIGAVPYIALQLKAVSGSLQTLLNASQTPVPQYWPWFTDLAFLVALVLSGFAIAFGTRHADATEHQDGLVVAIALESVVKLVSFVAIGLFVTYGLFDGLGDVLSQSPPPGSTRPDIWERTSGPGTIITLTVLSALAVILLPRQFHMAVVENRDPRDVRRLAWMFPLYLILINLFVIPIAIGGEVLLRDTGVDRDMTVLLLPLQAAQPWLALMVFIGGLSAATAMVIVASVALAIMISNHLVVPLMLRRRAFVGERVGASPGDLGNKVLHVRRIAIGAIMMLGYLYFRAAGEAALAAIGLLSFAAIAQLAPAFIGGLFWRRGTASGASAGLVVGILVWAYTLLIPSITQPDGMLAGLVARGPFGLAALRPESLFGLNLPSLTHGVLLSLTLNALFYVAFSLLRAPNASEEVQANHFIGSDTTLSGPSLRLWRSAITVRELQGTIARYLGEDRTVRAFESFAKSRNQPLSPDQEADAHLLQFGEYLLASAIGAASSRLVLSLLMKRRNLTTEAAFRLLDDASAALQYNRDLLQNALDHAGQGITVLDSDLRLRAWNKAFIDLYNLPDWLVRAGSSLRDIVRYNAERGSYGDGDIEQLVAQRLASFVEARDPERLRLHQDNRWIEVRTNTLPDGGLVTTYTDISETVAAEEALEERVKSRTEELLIVNEELKRAKAEADEANLSKTRFLAAASHDLLQPLNAARLYAAALVERDRRREEPDLAENIDSSLDAVEEILTALLDISRLDSGGIKPDWSTFRLDDVFRQLVRDFEPMAQEKGLTVTFVPTRATVRSDRRLLRRLLQNLVSNAIKYTPSGKVLIGCRWRGDRIHVHVIDTGLGIPRSKQKLVFREFQRLDEGAQVARGLGLGLSIVQRIARSLKHPLDLVSVPGRGSNFSIELPASVPAQLPPQAVNDVTPLPSPAALGLSVLVLDNEPAILDGTRRLLESWGCTVATAGDIQSARNAARILQPHVLLADYHLDPGEDGLSAVESLRNLCGRDLPAVLVTADRSPEVRERASACDVHILNKPVRPAALRALLAQWRVARPAAE